MKLSTAKRRINKTLDELCKSVVDDWYANFKNGYIKGYEDARQGKSPMYVEAYKIADTPQTDYEIAKAVVHNAIDNTAIAEDVYPDLRQRLHDAVENTPQAACKTCKHNGESWCGEHCYNCYGKDGYEPQTDCGWK